MIFKGKKVLVFGLGILGGGVATTNWLLKQGAVVTVTDLKTAHQLRDAVAQLMGSITFHLGGHSRTDIDNNDIIVINPDVSVHNEFIQYALVQKKIVLNEAAIFFNEFQKPIIAITGTRGKTTTTAWANHFLAARFRSSVAGNSTEFPFLSVLARRDTLDMAVAEVSSFHLELCDYTPIRPHIAIITNIYRDHLNRHQTLQEYTRVKMLIAGAQSSDDFCILNYDCLALRTLKLNAQRFFFSLSPLPESFFGIWYRNNQIWFRDSTGEKIVLTIPGFEEKYGEHNVANLLASALAAHCAGVSWNTIQDRIVTVPAVPFRQEIIFQNDRVTVINDTTATSPEGGIAALRRFAGPATILITGGTDRDLDFSEWAETIQHCVKSDNVIFIAGSATEKMRLLLPSWGSKIRVYETLKDCVNAAILKTSQYQKSVVLFSPAAKSFEKFKNEFDRGQQFNECIKAYYG